MIETRALLQALRLDNAADAVQFGQPPAQLLLDALDGLQQGRARRHIMRIGVDLHEFEIDRLLAGERVEFVNRLDLVAKETDAPGAVLVMRRKHVNRVAAHAKRPANEIRLDAAVLQRDEIGDQLPLFELFAQRDAEGHRGVGLDRADAVNAGHRGDDDDIVALQQRARGGVAHPVDLLVHRGFFFDIGVRARHIGLGLVIIVIGNEIFDGVVWKEALELAIELRRQRLVGREDERRPLRAGDDLRHRKCLAGAGDAKQHLVALSRLDPLHQFRDGARLVAARLIFRHQLEFDAALGFSRPLGTMRGPGLLVPDIRVAEPQKLIETVDRGLHAAAFAHVLGGRFPRFRRQAHRFRCPPGRVP